MLFPDDRRILEFLRTTFLAAKLLGCMESECEKRIRSSLFEANGFKADSLLTFRTRFSALDI